MVVGQISQHVVELRGSSSSGQKKKEKKRKEKCPKVYHTALDSPVKTESLVSKETRGVAHARNEKYNGRHIGSVMQHFRKLPASRRHLLRHRVETFVGPLYLIDHS